MQQYKVVGNTVPQHNFVVGSIVTMRNAGLTDDTAVFELAGTQSTLQVVNVADVEPVELGQQEAAVVLAGMVDAINRQVSDAERLADKHGLSFSIDIAYGMGGTFYGEGHDYVSGPRSWAEQGWNPSSMSC